MRRGAWCVACGIVGCAAVLAVGCNPEPGVVRTRAANEFSCRKSEITVKAIGGSSYRATGCGQEAEYTCATTRRSIACVHDDPAETDNDTAAPRSAERSPQKLHVARKPPAGAAGFTFGAAPDAVQGKCEAGGHNYEPADDDTGTCDGTPVDLGAPTTVTLHYCHGHLCRISLQLQPDASNLGKSLSAVEQALIGKYGSANDNEVSVPFDCTSKLAQCIQQGRAQVKMEWNFPAGDSIKLDVPKPDQGGKSPLIDIVYARKSAELGAGL